MPVKYFTTENNVIYFPSLLSWSSNHRMLTIMTLIKNDKSLNDITPIPYQRENEKIGSTIYGLRIIDDNDFLLVKMKMDYYIKYLIKTQHPKWCINIDGRNFDGNDKDLPNWE